MSGILTSLSDVREARKATGQLMLHIMKLPPEVGVQLGNIHRCLKEMEVAKEMEVLKEMDVIKKHLEKKESGR